MTPTAPFTCVITQVHDGDTVRCADGTRVRIAGVEANELRGGCHLPTCPAMPARQATAVVTRLTLRQRIVCQPVDRSYSRIVARCTLPDGRSLSCAAIAVGATVRWDRYWRRYGLGDCR